MTQNLVNSSVRRFSDKAQQAEEVVDENAPVEEKYHNIIRQDEKGKGMYHVLSFS